VAGRQGGDVDGADVNMAGPVERCAAGRRNAETLKNGVDAERGYEASSLKLRQFGQGADGSGAEMIVVVVGDDYGIDWRQVGKWKGRREETFGANPLGGSRTLLPDWIDEDANSIDLNQGGGVAHPGESEAGTRTAGEDARISEERTGCMLWRPCRRSQEEAGTDLEDGR